MLYGDGIHSDAAEIQSMLDSGMSVVYLPAPERCYCIDRTLYIHSNQTLRLDPTTTIRLLPHSDCLMLSNAPGGAHDVCILGGIWDFNNTNQRPNPFLDDAAATLPHLDGNPETVARYTDDYTGVVMRFFGVTRLRISGVTVKDPVTYCIQMAETQYFTVENIHFDQNDGNPRPTNMDGIHIDGGCRFGCIRNIQGTCYDDVVALNADDMHDGAISDIAVDGVFALNALRAVRLLSIKSPVSRISISNIFGTYYQNSVLIGYFYPFSGVRGRFDHIVLRNIFSSNAPRLPKYGKRSKGYVFAQIHVNGHVDITGLEIAGAHRREECGDIESLIVEENAHITDLSIEHMSLENLTGKPFPMIRIDGTVDTLYMNGVTSSGNELLKINGTVRLRKGE